MFRLLSKASHRSYGTYPLTWVRQWGGGEHHHRFMSSVQVDKERNNATVATSRTIIQSLQDFNPYAHSVGIFLGILGAAVAGTAVIYGKFARLNSEVQKERELRGEQVQKERELREEQAKKERALRLEMLQKERELRELQVQKERELREEQVKRVRAEMAAETSRNFLLYGYAEEFHRYQKAVGVYKEANENEEKDAVLDKVANNNKETT